MPVPDNKEDLKKAIYMNYAKLREDLLTVPEELTYIGELEGHCKGTLMSINNLVAYLIGWGELVLSWNQKIDNNEQVNFSETGYKWNELGKLALKFYDDYRELEYEALLDKLDSTVTSIFSLIDKKTNAELYEVEWYGKWTLGRMIQFNTSSPYANARGRIRKWKKLRESIPVQQL